MSEREFTEAEKEAIEVFDKLMRRYINEASGLLAKVGCPEYAGQINGYEFSFKKLETEDMVESEHKERTQPLDRR